MFITIEGPDGVGKSTVIDGLKKLRPDALFIREPGTTTAGEKIRKMLLTDDYKLQVSSEVLLFLTSFCETCANVIRPAIDEEKLVIADRWYYSTYAYQSYANFNSDIKTLLDTAINCCYILKPNINILLMAPWNVLETRMINRGGTLDKMESREIYFKRKVYEYYDEHCIGKVVDADNTEEVVLQNVLNVIKDHGA